MKSHVKLDTSALLQPEWLVFPPPWVGHIPFAAWLVALLRPRLLVELGTHSGNSYCAFCQSMVENKVDGKAFAVDTWQGDEHSHAYGEEILAALSKHHDSRYGYFSTLLRTTFDDAASRFDDGSIDLLHIDGLHTYEAVRHDFDKWRPRLSGRGVVLLHDTHVHERNFGVHQLLEELSSAYPTFSFPHSHGLGIVLVGDDRNSMLLQACNDPGCAADLQATFGHLGAAVRDRYELERLKPELAETSAQLVAHRRSVHEYSLLVKDLRLQVQRKFKDIEAIESVLDAVRSELHEARTAIDAQSARSPALHRGTARRHRQLGNKDN